jgi:hypothetical protein
MGACALQCLCTSPSTDPQIDMDTLTYIFESFSLSEVHKRSLASRFCFVLCETVSDKDTLSNCWGIILPIGQMSLYVTVAPTINDTVRTSLPKEIRVALRSIKTLFYQGGTCSHRGILDSAASGGPLLGGAANLALPRPG